MTQLGGNNIVDFGGIGSDTQNLFISIKDTLSATKDILVRNKKKMIGKLFLTSFVLSFMFIAINMNYPIKKDLCQDDDACLKRQDNLMATAYAVMACMVVGIIFSYLTFCQQILKIIRKTIGQIQVPFIVLPVSLATYVMRRIIAKKLSLLRKLTFLLKYVGSGKFKKAWFYFIDPDTRQVFFHYIIFWWMVGLTVVSIVFPNIGVKLVPIGKIVMGLIMLVFLIMMFMWIPAIDYIFSVVDINDDQKVSKMFSSGLYVIYPISFIVSFYLMALLMFHMLFVGKLRRFF